MTKASGWMGKSTIIRYNRAGEVNTDRMPPPQPLAYFHPGTEFSVILTRGVGISTFLSMNKVMCIVKTLKNITEK